MILPLSLDHCLELSEKEQQSASALATDDDCVAQTCRQYAGQTVPRYSACGVSSQTSCSQSMFGPRVRSVSFPPIQLFRSRALPSPVPNPEHRRQLTGTVAREPQLVHTISPSPPALHLAPLTMEMMPVLTPLLTLVLALTWKVLVETPFRRKSSIHTRFFTSLEVLQG
jgi:hypothetical protein